MIVYESVYNSLKIYDVATDEVFLTLVGHNKLVNTIVWSPDG